MNRCAVTLHVGRSRNSYASPSVKLFTAAFAALYAGLPLLFQSTFNRLFIYLKRVTHGGLVIPCLEPVLITMA
jgi:hypothetical protein